MAEDTNKFIEGISTERRQFPRLAATVDIGYNILDKKQAEEKTVTKNISSGGICLIVYEKIPIGTPLALSLHISDINCTIKAKGKVIWSSYFTVGQDKRERYDLGIEFTEIAESDRQKISQYVFRLK